MSVVRQLLQPINNYFAINCGNVTQQANIMQIKCIMRIWLIFNNWSIIVIKLMICWIVFRFLSTEIMDGVYVSLINYQFLHKMHNQQIGIFGEIVVA